MDAARIDRTAQLRCAAGTGWGYVELRSPGGLRHDASCLTAESGEVVLDGEAGGRGSRGDIELAVDRAQVLANRARADEQPARDLSIGHAQGDQAENLDFAGREPTRNGLTEGAHRGEQSVDSLDRRLCMEWSQEIAGLD